MSAQTAIDSLLGQLKSMSGYYSQIAYDLVNQADATLRKVKIDSPKEIEFEPVRGKGDLSRIPRPPEVEPLELPELPKVGALTGVTQYNGAALGPGAGDGDTFTGTMGALDFPTFRYAPLKGVQEFSDTAPEPTPLTLLRKVHAPFLVEPQLPIIQEGSYVTDPITHIERKVFIERKNLVEPKEITVEPLSGTPPELYLPVFDTPFEGDMHEQYLDGLALTAKELADWSAWLKTLRAELAPLEASLTEHLRQVIAGTETALEDTWETNKYQQAQQEINADRRGALTALDAAPSSITGLPTGAMAWARLELELKTLQATTQAAGKVSQERQAQEVKHLQWALTLAVKMIDAALSLKASEIGWKMKGLMLALDGAEATLELALKVLALKEREIEMLLQYNAGQQQRLELLMTIEKSKLEVIKTTLANNANISAYNTHQLQAYRIASSFVETKIKLFQAKIEAPILDKSWQRLKLQSYEADVAVFQANVKANALEYTLLKAKIAGDEALTKAELAKIKVYEAELKAYAANVRSQALTIKAQVEQNKTVLEAYSIEAEAKLASLRAVDESIKLVLTALVRGFSAEELEQEIKLHSQELNDRYVLYNAVNDMQKDHLTTSDKLKKQALLLAQRSAQGKMIVQGAGVSGGIAGQALAGMNAIGAKEIVESA